MLSNEDKDGKNIVVLLQSPNPLVDIESLQGNEGLPIENSY